MPTIPTKTPSQQKKGTGFTNLQRYLAANKGNTLGSTVSGGISSAAEGVQGGLQGASEQFASQSAAGDLASDQNKQVRDTVLQRLSGGGGGGMLFAPGMLPSVTPGEVSQFEKFRGGQYTGPKQLEGVDKLSAQAREAEGLGKATSTETGRTGLLQRFVGSPQYTQGQRNLDTLLLGRAPELSSARQKTLGLESSVGRESQRAGATAAQKTSDARKFGQETTGMIQGQRGQVDTGLQGQLTSQKQAADAAQAEFLQAQQSGKFAAGDQSLTGLRHGETLYNINLSDPRFFAENDPTLSGVATPEQRAQLAALAQLSGQDLSQFYQGLDPKAAQYDPAKPYAFNKGAFDQEAARTQNLVNQAVQNTKIQHPAGPQFGEISLPEATTYVDKELTDATNRLKNTGSFALSPSERAQFQSYVQKLTDQKAALQAARDKATAQWTPNRKATFAVAPDTGYIPPR